MGQENSIRTLPCVRRDWKNPSTTRARLSSSSLRRRTPPQRAIAEAEEHRDNVKAELDEISKRETDLLKIDAAQARRTAPGQR